MSCLIESLEPRRLFAGDPTAGVSLPFRLDFNRGGLGGLVDRDGTGTGFSYVQPNRGGDEYQAGKIDLRIGVGLLRMYSVGTATSGSAFDSDNTGVNILQNRFQAGQRAWIMYTRVLGPPTEIDQPHEQGGLFWGLDQDNYVKLVLAAEGGKVGLQFIDEQKFSSGIRHSLPNTIYEIGSFASANTVDLYLQGHPESGYVRALYSVNGGPIIELPNRLILKDDKRAGFFSANSFGGLMSQHKNSGPGIGFTVDVFGIKRGEFPDLRPAGGKISTAVQRQFNDVRGGAGQTIGARVRNDGTTSLTIPANGLTISGPDAAMFGVATVGALPITLQPGQSTSLKITFSAADATPAGIKTATLAISSNDPNTPVKNVALRGLATTGTGGTNEPSLKRLLDLYQIPINVGDTNPDDVFIGDPPATPNEEVTIQQFKKAGTGPVLIQPLGVFGVSSSPALRFGYYEPGSPAKTTELLTIDTADAQTVNPFPVGITSFDPGSAAFAFYSVWPGFKNTDNTVRTIYSEDLFNTFDTHLARHIRFYPLKNSDGSVVANSYVMAHEEFNGGYDFQDFVAIVSNVTSAMAGPEIGTDNLDGPPAPDRLVFNRFQAGDPLHPETVSHRQAKVRVRNSGTSNLNISSIGVSGPFSVLSPTGAIGVLPGKFTDVLVQFDGGSTAGFKSGTLTINSNDVDEPAKTIALTGFNQPAPEGSNEATLATIVNQVFGYTTIFANPGDVLSNGGKVEAVGEEVLSPYWFRVNPNLPVSVRQISSFHTQGDTATIRWHNKGSTSQGQIFTIAGTDAQTLYPRLNGTLAAGQGTFTPSTVAFGFRVDLEWSDDTRNHQEQGGGGYGHHLRFFPLRDGSGALVPDTYLLVMDYNGVNYDYNDNIYIISNIRPETP